MGENAIQPVLRSIRRYPPSPPLAVIIHPFAALSAQVAGLHQLGQQGGGPVLVAQLLLQAFDAPVDHVESRGVGRLEGTDREPEAAFTRLVDLLGRTDTLL